MQPELIIPQFDAVLAFTDWFTRQPFVLPPSVANGVHRVGEGKFTGLTLYRSGQFQAQLWLCDPGSEIHDHAHPEVDIVQVYVSGQVYLRVNGELRIKPEDVFALNDGRSSKNQYWVRVNPGDVHGATIGPQGGAFLTFQHWLRDEPKSVELQWEGEPLDALHAQALEGTFAA